MTNKILIKILDYRYDYGYTPAYRYNSNSKYRNNYDYSIDMNIDLTIGNSQIYNYDSSITKKIILDYEYNPSLNDIALRKQSIIPAKILKHFLLTLITALI